MSMIEWARNEIRLANENNKKHMSADEYEYVEACNASALKAYESLCEDEHSGLSFSITARILKTLMNNEPLTAIEDRDDVWNDVTVMQGSSGERKIYQCKRKSGLFKDVYANGDVTYNDIDRVTCYDVNHPALGYHSSLVSNFIDKMYPISLPYHGEQIEVYTDEFLTDTKNGDFDTVGILYMYKNGSPEKIEINKFYKCDDGLDNDWVELTEEQFNERKKNKIDDVA